MFENAIYLGIGFVVGVVYHAKLQPYVTKAWTWIKGHIGVRKDAP